MYLMTPICIKQSPWIQGITCTSEDRTSVIILIKVRKQPHAINCINTMSIFCFGNNVGKKRKIELVVYQVIPV